MMEETNRTVHAMLGGLFWYKLQLFLIQTDKKIKHKFKKLFIPDTQCITCGTDMPTPLHPNSSVGDSPSPPGTEVDMQEQCYQMNLETSNKRTSP
jgi:hypothetical protein